jgi:hypothetical protein
MRTSIRKKIHNRLKVATNLISEVHPSSSRNPQPSEDLLKHELRAFFSFGVQYHNRFWNPELTNVESGSERLVIITGIHDHFLAKIIGKNVSMTMLVMISDSRHDPNKKNIAGCAVSDP